MTRQNSGSYYMNTKIQFLFSFLTNSLSIYKQTGIQKTKNTPEYIFSWRKMILGEKDEQSKTCMLSYHQRGRLGGREPTPKRFGGWEVMDFNLKNKMLRRWGSYPYLAFSHYTSSRDGSSYGSTSCEQVPLEPRHLLCLTNLGSYIIHHQKKKGTADLCKPVPTLGQTHNVDS